MNPSALLGLLAFASAIVAAPLNSRPTPGSRQSIQNLKDKIKNVVLITMENRSVDNLLGGQTIRGLENPINNGPFCNPVNLTNPHAGIVCSQPKDFDSVAEDPDHSVPGNNIEFYSTFEPDNAKIAAGNLTPTMQGFVHEQIRQNPTGNQTVAGIQVMNFYTEDQVPVITELTQQFVTFNDWFSGVPGPTDPNRAYILSGTSSGHGTNDASFAAQQPQRSIFQQLAETNHTWSGYEPVPLDNDALFFNWTVSTPGQLANIKDMETFFQDAYLGTLPEFTFIEPSCCAVGTTSMHPSGLIADGEVLLKQIYDAVRGGPQWENMLFIITFDETGGFHDHKAPPRATPPDDLTFTTSTPDGRNYTFGFDRLGGRVPTWLISPWVDVGHVEQLGTNAQGQQIAYSATSILRTLGYLWDFEPFNPRIAESPSFDHLIGTNMRKNTPETMPVPIKF